MKIFGIGLNKTGTKTLRACLTRFTTRHLSYDLESLQWLQQGNLDALFARIDQYESFEDWPWPLMYRLLDARYADARFVLTLRRDADTWFRSLAMHAENTGPTEFRKRIYGYYMPEENPDAHIQFYHRHNDAVRRYFRDRPEKLLVACWEDGTGWQEICGFLGRPIPPIPFPHENRASPERTPRPRMGPRNTT